jgi:integrase
VCGLPWRAVDLENGTLEVVQQVERVGKTLSIEPPNTDRSARTIKLPQSLVRELERHRKEQLEQRLKLGMGGKPELVFTMPLGQMLDPDYVSDAFTTKIAETKLKAITFHGLRHTHITLLLKGGVPVHVVSARAGHAKPSVTLDMYSHLLGGEDNDAAKQAEAILLRVLK